MHKNALSRVPLANTKIVQKLVFLAFFYRSISASHFRFSTKNQPKSGPGPAPNLFSLTSCAGFGSAEPPAKRASGPPARRRSAGAPPPAGSPAERCTFAFFSRKTLTFRRKAKLFFGKFREAKLSSEASSSKKKLR